MAELMKGEVWAEKKHLLTYPAYAEIKHDEIRCHVKVTNYPAEGWRAYFYSYSGKPLANMQRFANDFIESVRGVLNYTEFDLGFEVNGNFNDSYRWVRSTKALPVDLQDAPVKFFLFDLPESRLGFDDRRDARVEVMRHFNRQQPSARMYIPEGRVVGSEADVDEYFREAVQRGYEGLMVKELYHLYQRKRTRDWLKLKPENEADGQIVGFEEAVCGVDQPELGLKEGDPLGRVGSVLVQCEDGSQASPHSIAHDLGRDMLQHPEKYLHRWCMFKYMERDRRGGYRHPVFGRLREDK